MNSLLSASLRAAGSIVSPAGRRARLSVLIYHRVLAAPDPLLPSDPDESRFRWHMECLAAHFSVLPLAEAVARLREGNLPSRAAAITFDDGYRDNHDRAVPILKSIGLPATFFIATAYLDGGRMWNDTVIEAIRRTPRPELDLTAVGLGRSPTTTLAQRRDAMRMLLKSLKYRERSERQQLSKRVAEAAGIEPPSDLMMTSAQVRALHQAGLEIGGHTASHPILTRLSDAEAEAEIAGGKAALEEIIGAPVRLFAYPNGKPGTDYNATHVAIAKRTGFAAALSTSPGAADDRVDLYQLPRFTPWDAQPARFVARLLRNAVVRGKEI